MNMSNINVTPQFVTAGEATFTVSNGKGDHRTFHVYKSKPSVPFPNPAYFVKMLVGPDNADFDRYKYLGKLDLGGAEPRLLITSRSHWKEDSEPVKIARWALRVIWQVRYSGYRLPDPYSIKHIGRCGKCGAILTNPASLDTGLGPECASQLGIEWKEHTGPGVRFDLQERETANVGGPDMAREG